MSTEIVCRGSNDYFPFHFGGVTVEGKMREKGAVEFRLLSLIRYVFEVV